MKKMILLKIKENPILQALLALFFTSGIIHLWIYGSLPLTKYISLFLLFFSLLTIMPSLFSGILTFLIESLFLRIHLKKAFLTDSPLIAIDLFEIKQAQALSGYSDPLISILIALILIVLLVGVVKQKKIRSKFLPVPLSIFLLFTIDFTSNDRSPWGLSSTLEKFGVVLNNFKWEKSVRRNGVLGHLLLTAEMVKIPKVSPHRFYTSFPGGEESEKKLKKPDIFIIMCESCFTTFDSKFQTPLLKLKDHNFQSSMIISPRYGGGTADVEFEALVGLPSNNLKGIKYQYYGESFSLTSTTLPRIFSSHNYRTVALHNFNSFFWNRQNVYPRMGFEQQYFLEDMNWKKEDKRDWRPEDDILYEKAQSVYSKLANSNNSLFFFLTTMSTHGPYEEENSDFGEKNYKERILKATNEIIKFQSFIERESIKRGRSALVVVFGDHKPSLNEVFKFKQVFTDTTDEIEKDKQIGGVPLFIKSISFNHHFSENLAKNMEEKPVFCLPGQIEMIINAKTKFYKSLRDACDSSTGFLVNHEWQFENFPLGLYGEVLFNNEVNTAFSK